jgi:hypothetical protein
MSNVLVMLESIINRGLHFISICKEGILGKWFGAAWSILGIGIVARDEFWRPSNEERWRVINMIPHISLAWWLIGALAIVIIWIFEASFRVAEKQNKRIASLKGDFSEEVRMNIDSKMRALSAASKSELYRLADGSIGLHQLGNETETELGGPL